MANEEDEASSSGTSYYLHLYLSIAAAISFWCQSVTTEERLVPALNVIADYHDIPDDVAGATLMAAGASSPELLCTLVSLFVTHSSLGLGTIVGSEVFNQLIICAGSVYAAKGEVLVLDRRMVTREVGFYALSIGLLYVAVSESRYYDDEDGDGEERICVSPWKAASLFGGYVLYVAVCSNMTFVERCIQKFGGRNDADDEEDVANGTSEHDSSAASDYQLQSFPNGDLDSSLDKSTSLGSVHYKSFDDHDLHQLPFIYNVTTEPVENWETAPDTLQSPDGPDDDNDGLVITSSSLSNDDENDSCGGSDIANAGKKKRRNILSAAIHKSFKLMKANHILCRDDYPVEMNDVYEMTSNDGAHEIGVFLWQRSVFYTRARFGSHAFHLRWFTIAPSRISSVPDRQEPDKHVLVYPLFDQVHVDEKRLIINIPHMEEGRRDFTLMAPSRAIFDAVVQSLEGYMNATRHLRQRGMTELEDEAEALVAMKKRDVDADPHVELIEMPRNASNLELALWVSVFPLRVLMHYTLPDVRHLDHHGQPFKSVSYAYLSTFSCLVWLIAGSYVMVASLERLAALMGVPDSIMGVTVSAAGTSLPAYIASRIAAEKGFGNQAVANVFGSNAFNICVGLGLPWLIYVVVTGFEPYHGLSNDGIIESVLVLAGCLLIFVVLMISSKFVLVKWHANLFIGLYTVYIVYSIGQVYW